MRLSEVAGVKYSRRGEEKKTQQQRRADPWAT